MKGPILTLIKYNRIDIILIGTAGSQQSARVRELERGATSVCWVEGGRGGWWVCGRADQGDEWSLRAEQMAGQSDWTS